MSDTLETLIAKIPGKAAAIIERGDKKFVLYTQHFEADGDCYVSWNIVAIDSTPKIVWRASPGPDLMNEENTAFTSLYIGQDNQLMAYGWTGYDYVIDESTGLANRWHDPSWPPGYKPRPW